MSEDKKSKQKSVKTDDKKSEQDSATLKDDGTKQTDTEKQDDPKAVVSQAKSLYKNYFDAPMDILISHVLNHELDLARKKLKIGMPMLKSYELSQNIYKQTNRAISVRNMVEKSQANKEKRSPDLWRMPTKLTPYQIARLIDFKYPVVLLNLSNTNTDSQYDQIAIYQEDGEDKGIYSFDADKLAAIVRAFSPGITTKDLKEVDAALRTIAPHVSRCKNQDLVPVNNGIFNYKTKELIPFDPKYVFISKSHVDYVDHPNKPVLNNPDGTKWDPDSWMNSLSDDPQVVHVLWQILGAIIRPNVRWDKSAWLYSTHGNNGKGTLCELMRNLCGPGAYAKVALSDFSNEFMLEPLASASAIITDENDVGTFIDKAANLKAIETGDVITINRKYKAAIAYQFNGFMVQCLNEFPKVKDKSNSFYRRQLFIPMTKNFQGRERKYIKQKYLKSQQVLEYILWKILYTTDYYTLDIPDACQATMMEYKDSNDPIRQFLSEVLPEVKWDLLPFNFLYDLYRAWFIRNVPNGKAISKFGFTSELKDIFLGQTVSTFTYEAKQERTGHRMDKPEPLILDYHLSDWMNPGYNGTDRTKKCTPIPKDRYSGLIRVSAQNTQKA